MGVPGEVDVVTWNQQGVAVLQLQAEKPAITGDGLLQELHVAVVRQRNVVEELGLAFHCRSQVVR